MVKAVVKNGVFVPRSPLPQDWPEGTEVEVDRPLVPSEPDEEIDRWLAEMEAIAAQGNPEDDRHLEAALQQHRQEQKDLTRKKAGLPA